MKEEINFAVFENNSEHKITTYTGEYRNLMFLLKDKLLLEEFGECGGIGRCATCVMKINGLLGNSVVKERNEPVTLAKIGYEKDNIRLACQLLITEDLNEAVIELIEM